MKKILLSLCLCAWLPVCAQTLRLKGTLVGDALKDIKLSLRLVDATSETSVVPLTVADGTFSGQFQTSKSGFYYLCGVTGSSQIMLPVYLPGTGKEYNMALTMTDGCPMTDSDKDNKALSAFNLFYYKHEREFWTEAGGWAEDKFLPFLRGYSDAADSIFCLYDCTPKVRAFIDMWACSAAYGDMTSISHVSGIKPAGLPFSASDLFGDMTKRLDNPFTVFFPVLTQAVIHNIPKGSLTERMEYLHSHYTSAEVISAVKSALVSGFIRQYDFNNHFDEGLAELKSVTEKYSLDSSYLRDFEARKSTVKGTPFPDVTLTDTDGRAVSFSTFRGSYVYVDMWASWCGPCCKEAPYLQALEKEFAGNSAVKFVSISIDENTASWKKKMADLGLHGNQLLNKDNRLAEALNVRGIPFFIIYDREGKLYMYNAPRPSNPETKTLLSNLPQ